MSLSKLAHTSVTVWSSEVALHLPTLLPYLFRLIPSPFPLLLLLPLPLPSPRRAPPSLTREFLLAAFSLYFLLTPFSLAHCIPCTFYSSLRTP